MNRRGLVYFDRALAGLLLERATGGARFSYEPAWLADPEAPAISLTLPKREEPYEWDGPSPFFMGLLPEGWLHTLAIGKYRLAADDWFGQILALCGDCVGAVTVEAEEHE